MLVWHILLGLVVLKLWKRSITLWERLIKRLSSWPRTSVIISSWPWTRVTISSWPGLDQHRSQTRVTCGWYTTVTCWDWLILHLSDIPKIFFFQSMGLLIVVFTHSVAFPIFGSLSSWTWTLVFLSWHGKDIVTLMLHCFSSFATHAALSRCISANSLQLFRTTGLDWSLYRPWAWTFWQPCPFSWHCGCLHLMSLIKMVEKTAKIPSV